MAHCRDCSRRDFVRMTLGAGAAAEPPRASRTKSRREQLEQCAIRHPINTNSVELKSIQKMSA